MNGAFITLEGTDSAALATQLKVLQDDLTSQGYAVEVVEFPRNGEPSSYFTAQYMQGYYGPVQHINSYASSMFYALDFHDAASQIRTALGRGKVVIASRYTGAVMAEQGVKITNSEQRKGFYLWLENLSYILLACPRPDLSIVLRAPAVAEGSNIGDVYDDISQVFPKDFWQLHTVPVGKQLSNEQINKLILDRVKSFLPELAATPAAPTAVTVTERHEIKLRISLLAKMRLAGCVHMVDVTPADSMTEYHIPEGLDQEAHKEYSSLMDKLVRQRDELRKRLAGYLFDDLLPAASMRDVIISGSEHELSRAIAQLEADGAPESLQIARQLMETIGLEVKELTTGKSWVASLAQKLGGGNHGESQKEISARLLDYSPRNELNLIAAMFFTQSNLPLYELRAMTDSWPYDQKQQVYSEYLQRVRQHGQDTQGVLRLAHYSLEILTSVGAMLKLQHAVPDLESISQELTPRYGFNVPDVVDQAGLTEDYEEAFSISLQIHSLLHSKLSSTAAQYAVLGGHKIRSVLSINGENFIRLKGLQSVGNSSQELKELITEISSKIGEVHPLLAR